MSVEDVCELGSLLQSGDKEKEMLERKLIELDGGIQNQDRRLNHEVEAELWARNEQCNLLEGAIDVSNNFEISSSVVGQLEADAASTNHLSNILRRVKAYIALRDELADDISSVHNEIERIQAASKRVEIMQTEALPSSIADSKNSLADNEAIVKSMRQSLSDIKSDITKRRAQIEENLVTGALNITKSFSRLEQSQVLVNDKMKDLERKAAAQRLETESVLRELEIARAASSAHVTEADLEKSRMAAVKEGIMMSTKKNEGLLSVFEADNALLQKSLNDSSEAENATAKELEDAKSLLNFLEKFASENNDELHRIRRAQAFEKVREEAFVNSQSGNTGSVQQISNEADRLRASLELVRAEIILRKQQISSDGCKGADGAIHEELLVLQVADKKNRTRSETARNGIVMCTAEIARLIEQQSAASAQMDAVAERREALESSLDAIVKRKQITIERIKETSAKIDGALPRTRDLVAATEVMNTELTGLSVLLKMAESEAGAAEEHSVVVSAAAEAHAEKLLVYNAEKGRQYERSESAKRLQLIRQRKLAEFEKALQLLQDELNQEDYKFKEAIKSAEYNAKTTEEKLIATMNEVIEVGLQLVAERNSREKECKEVEAAVSLAHEEYKEQLAALAEAVAMESAAILRQSAAQSTSCISTQSQRDVPRPQTSRGKLTGKAMGSSQSQPPSSPVAHSTPLGTNDAGLRRRKREQRAQGESQKSGLHKDSVSQLQHNVTNKSWGSSSPATILPRHSQPQSDGDEAAEEGDLPLPSTQPHRIRHSLPDKQEELRNQKQNQDRRRNTTGGMKSKRMPVGSADTIAERSVASTTSESIAQMRRKSRLPTSLRIADTQQGHTGRSDLTTSSVTGPFAGNRGRREDESSSDDSIESKETSRKQQMKRHGRGRQM